MRSFPSAAYTLVELLVALALSLLLLLAVTELLGRVGGTMNDTRSAMSASANLHEAAILLRQDLAQIPRELATKPQDIAAGVSASDQDGYLEITEGPDTPSSHPYVDELGNVDPTVGDVDDIIGFTVLSSRRGLLPADESFRGVMYKDGELRIEEREAAEIIWFVRGNTLYRRMRLIDDQRVGDPNVNTLSDLAHRQRRFGHDTLASGAFPYPRYLYDDATNAPRGWYYFRMPTLEETLHEDWDWDPTTFSTVILPGQLASEPNPDLWEQPYFFPELQDKKSGSLTNFVQTPRHVRAGEDVVLTHVLSFDVKVWCPDMGDFVDLGDPRSETWHDSNSTEWINEDDPSDKRQLPRTWDSWTRSYGDDNPKYKNDKGIIMPPYAAPLEAIQITIRCFDPASRAIKQVTVVHRFGK